MARPTREGYRQLSTQVLGELLDGMQEMAERNGRSLADELMHAMRRHIAHPPDFLQPPLPSEKITPPPAVLPKKRGRKPKE